MYIAIVRMDTPAVDHETAVNISLGSTATFTALKEEGLLMKYYLSSDSGGSGGVYLWRSKADADAWFTPEWFTRLKDTYGAEPVIEFYDSFVQVDNMQNQIRVDGDTLSSESSG